MTPILRRAALLALALVATACSDEAPTAAPAAPDPAPNALLSGLLSSATQLLQEQTLSELARVAAAKTVNDALYATLHPTWQLSSPLTSVLNLSVLSCEPLPYSATVQTVGAEGGVLKVGPHRFTIPANALSKPTVITAETPVGLTRNVRFAPHGLKFARATKLEMSYVGCRMLSGTVPTMVYVDEQLNILEWVTSRVLSGSTVQGDVWHFSDYAIGRRSSYATSW